MDLWKIIIPAAAGFVVGGPLAMGVWWTIAAGAAAGGAYAASQGDDVLEGAVIGGFAGYGGGKLGAAAKTAGWFGAAKTVAPTVAPKSAGLLAGGETAKVSPWAAQGGAQYGGAGVPGGGAGAGEAVAAAASEKAPVVPSSWWDKNPLATVSLITMAGETVGGLGKADAEKARLEEERKTALALKEPTVKSTGSLLVSAPKVNTSALLERISPPRIPRESIKVA